MAAGLWGAAAAAFWLWTAQYEFTPGGGGDASAESWPAATRLELAADRPTLLLFIHPRCPCTRASVRELDRLLTGRGLTAAQQPSLQVVATTPTDATEDWGRSPTTLAAAALPHAALRQDPGGDEALRFGAATSGAVMLYRPDGRRLYSGGVTASRGHEGGNVGCDRLLAVLSGRDASPQPSAPTFGCLLCLEPQQGLPNALPTGGLAAAAEIARTDK